MRISKIFLLTLMTVALAGLALAQDNKTVEPQATDPQQLQAPRVGVNLLQQLGLSPEQVQQIRKVNQERRPQMEEAQRRFREANRALDAAIYSDEVNDADFQARLKDVQVAQAEIQRLRYLNELAVRRILTPEQLLRFRDMRQRFEDARREAEARGPFRNGMRDRRQMAPGDNRPGIQPSRVVKQDQPKPVQ